MPISSHSALVNALLPSSCAAARLGPKHRMPAVRKSSPRPATAGASGPMTTKSMPSRLLKAMMAPWSVMSSGTLLAMVSVPPLPGATNSFSSRGDLAIPHARACSRPPEPITSTRMDSLP